MPGYRQDQFYLLQQLAKYLRKNHLYSPVIKQFEDVKGGHCSGFTFVWLYAKWLTEQAALLNDPNAKYDDINWFNHTIKLISTWDGERRFNKEDHESIIRFIHNISFYQNISDYLNVSKEGPFSQVTIDNKGTVLLEHTSLGMSLTQDELIKVKNLINPNNLPLFIGSTSHMLGLYHHDFYNSNNFDGESPLNKDSDLHSNISLHECDDNSAVKTVYLGVVEFTRTPHEVKYYHAHDVYKKILSDNHFFKTAKDRLRFIQDNLCVCIAQGYIEAAKVLMTELPDLNFNSSDQTSPLCAAVQSNEISYVNFILNKGAAPNYYGENLYNPILTAFLNGVDFLIIERLVKSGANLDSVNKRDETTTTCALKYDNFDFLEYLKQKNSLSPKVHQRYGNILTLAARHNAFNCFKFLHKNFSGESFTASDRQGNDVFLYAVKHNNLEVTKFLFDHGYKNINKINNSGRNALGIAVLNENKEMIKFLLNNGIDLNCADNKGITALHLAVGTGNRDIVNLLLKKYNCVNTYDKAGRSPVSYLISIGRLDIAEDLFNKAIDFDKNLLFQMLKSEDSQLQSLAIKAINSLLTNLHNTGKLPEPLTDLFKYYLEQGPEKMNLPHKNALEYQFKEYEYVSDVYNLIETVCPQAQVRSYLSKGST